MSEVLRLLRSREGTKLVIAGNRRNFEYSASILRSNIWHGKDPKNLHSDSLLQYGSIYRSDYFTYLGLMFLGPKFKKWAHYEKSWSSAYRIYGNLDAASSITGK